MKKHDTVAPHLAAYAPEASAAQQPPSKRGLAGMALS